MSATYGLDICRCECVSKLGFLFRNQAATVTESTEVSDGISSDAADRTSTTLDIEVASNHEDEVWEQEDIEPLVATPPVAAQLKEEDPIGIQFPQE